MDVLHPPAETGSTEDNFIAIAIDDLGPQDR